ncbi:MAG: cytochrome c-type biogenesis protein CcdA [Nitrospira sp.]|nr:MAG: cytochrome c-type biogenesis protein CcdA [Nitrospira sp.]
MREPITQGTATVVASAQVEQAARARPLIHALLFVLGFSVIFVALGMVVSGIGQLAFDLRAPLARIGGVVVILFGLATMGLFGALSRRLGHLEDSAAEEGAYWWLLPVGWMKGGIDLFLRYFYADTRADWGRRSGSGYVPSFLMGMFFSAGWTPCIGPTLGAIMALGYSTATISQGAFLLSGYSLGLGIPFVLFALALDRASGLLRSLKRHIRTLQLINGALLILIGFALLTKQLAIIARWAEDHNLYLDVGSLGGTTPTFFIAILAGLLSFLSPCVLPLVPAYVFYLTGRTISKTTAN